MEPKISDDGHLHAGIDAMHESTLFVDLVSGARNVGLAVRGDGAVGERNPPVLEDEPEFTLV